MQIIYRACPTGNPKNKVMQNKYNLVSTCFNSLLDCFDGCEYNLTVVLDKPTSEFKKLFSGFNVIETHFSTLPQGNLGTFKKQIEIALDKNEPFLFVEDDYYFLPDLGQHIINALNALPFITPYDHPDHYDMDPYKRDIKLIGDRHWVSVCSTTLTFGGQPDLLRKYLPIIEQYGIWDHPMWSEITKETPLYCPIPSIATHMEVEWIAPTMKDAWLQTH